MSLIIVSLVILFKLSTSGNDTVYAFHKYEGYDCQGMGDPPQDILRDFEGNATDCMAKCSELNCDGFIRVNSNNRNGNNGQCFFRDGLERPVPNTLSDNRDCYEPIAAYKKYEGYQCPQLNDSDANDVLRDFAGTAEECASKCTEMEDCVSFVRINEDYTPQGRSGLCYLRGYELLDPVPNTLNDDRDCFIPTDLNGTFMVKYYGITSDPTMDPTQAPTSDPTRNPITPSGNNTIYAYKKYQGYDCQGTGDPLDILRDFEGNATDCMAKCSELDCDGFIRVNSNNKEGNNGQCFFRNGLGRPHINTYLDNRDCYEPIAAYIKYEGYQCPQLDDSDANDVLRDYAGTAEECALKCTEMEDCVSFVRVNNKARAGLCYLRGYEFQEPIPNTLNDDRDCYVPTTLDGTFKVKYYGNGTYTLEPTMDFTDAPSMKVTSNSNPTKAPVPSATYGEQSGCVSVYRFTINLFVFCVVSILSVIFS